MANNDQVNNIQEQANAFYEKGEAEWERKNYGNAAEWYRKAADLGHTESQKNLGWCYESGEGVNQDLVKAVELYRKAAEQGNVKAQRNLGLKYYHGEGINQDFAKAVEWLSKAAAQGEANAQGILAVCYYNGQGVKQDDAKAIEWWRKAAANGDESSKNILAQLESQDKIASKNSAQHTAPQTLPPNSANNDQIQTLLAQANALVEQGQGDNAIQLYLEAANLGSADAYFILYKISVEVYGDDPQFKETGNIYLHKAAETGHINAQAILGFYYLTGEGVQKDEAQAAKWFLKAAEQGNPSAQCQIGLMLYSGKGIQKDEAQAAKWFQKAAEQGNPDAQYQIGLRLYEKDKKEGLKWFSKAADQGHEKAKTFVNLINDAKAEMDAKIISSIARSAIDGLVNLN